jgi:hypothetical protein
VISGQPLSMSMLCVMVETMPVPSLSPLSQTLSHCVFDFPMLTKQSKASNISRKTVFHSRPDLLFFIRVQSVEQTRHYWAKFGTITRGISQEEQARRR